MDIRNYNKITFFDVKGYQALQIEETDNSVFLYLGDNFIAFTKQEWRRVATEMFNVAKGH